MEIIDLSKYNYQGLHKLFQHHFVARASARGRALSDANETEVIDNEVPGSSLQYDAAVPPPELLGRHAADGTQGFGWVTFVTASPGLTGWMMVPVALLGLSVIAWSLRSRRGRGRGNATKAASVESDGGMRHVA